jgi:predicted RND superfamily exporter protein
MHHLRTWICALLLLTLHNRVAAQSEAESSVNSLLVKSQQGIIAQSYSAGDEIEFVMRDRYTDIRQGKIEDIGDSTLQVDGVIYPAAKIGTIIIHDQTKTDVGVTVGIFALITLFLSGVALAYALLAASYSTLVAIAVLGFFFFGFAMLPLATIAIVFLAMGKRKHLLIGQRFRLAIVELRAQFDPVKR